MKLKTLSLLSAAIGLSSPLASAAVTVVSTVTGSLASNPATTQSITYTPTTAGNVIVIGTYVDNGTPAYANVLFDGVASTGQLTTGRSLLAYTYTSDASVTITFSNTAAFNNGYVIYELSGVDTTQLAILSTGTTITTTEDDQFLVSVLGVNGDPAGATNNGTVITDVGTLSLNPGSGGGGLVYGSGTADAAGSQAVGWTIANQTGQINAAFTAAVVPEPSVALLGAFGAMTLLRRRRA